MVDTSYLLTDEQMRKFISEGFLILKADFPKEFHSKMLETLNNVYTSEGNPGNNLLPRVPELQKVFDHPSVKGALTSVLGPDYIMHPHRHGHYNKVPHPGGWHKDSYWGYDRIRNHHPWWAMIFYYPQDVTIDMGPTGVVPGTQNYRERSFESDELENQVKADGEAGTFVLVHYDIWHRANANLVGKDRFMLKFQFTRMSSPTTPSWNNKEDNWVTPASFTTELHPHQAMWEDTWNWLRGEIGPTETEASFTQDTLEQAQLLEQLQHPDQAIRVKAADQLGIATSSSDSEVVSELGKALEDSYEPVSINAAYGLARKGDHGIKQLISGLTSANELTSRNAAFGLAAAGPKALYPLLDVLETNNKTAIAGAAFALGELREHAKIAIPTFINLLNDEDVIVRREVVEALGLVGSSEKVIEALERGMNDSDQQVRFMSGLSLARLGSMAKDAVPTLLTALEDENRYVRGYAVDALQRIGTVEALNGLINYLKTARWCPTTTPDNPFYP